MTVNRTREGDLIDPVLRLILKHRDESGGLDITKIDRLLREQIALTEIDKTILKGRKDDKFSQVVRNLVSHRTLERDGLAEYRNDGTFKRGAYYLTIKGAVRIGGTTTIRQPDLFD